jgi:hypothetical protein
MPKQPTIENREKWLQTAATILFANHITPHLQPTETPEHSYRVSVGWPQNKSAIGECWKKEASDDDTSEIFISPAHNDSLEVLATLLHELIHYCDNCESGHKRFFKRIARKAGLQGKLTATTAGDELTMGLLTIVDNIGEIPHAKLNRSKNGKKKQGTRMLKTECNNVECGFSFRSSKTQLEKLPEENLCPCCELGTLTIKQD